MSRLRIPGYCLLALLAAGRVARAEPIQYGAASFMGLDGVTPMSPIPLPDLTKGGTVLLGSPTLAGGGGPADPSIDRNVFFQLGALSAPGSSGPFREPLLLVSAHITGSIGPQMPGISSLDSGGFSGMATSISLSSVPAGTAVPQPLLDLLHNPGRIHLDGLVTGGAANLLKTTLTIDPAGPGNPTLVPEPSAFATILTLLGGGLAFRLRRMRPRAPRGR